MATNCRFFWPIADNRRAVARRAFTLVEMLIAMAITLLMMAAVVTLFANVSNSVRNRRATVEMSGQLRQLRNTLQQDLQGATCPGVTWQRPESNHGYIEIIEGQYREGNASRLIDGVDDPDMPDFNPEINHAISILPSSNLPVPANWATDGAGLGDYDDILMLTVRNEHEPFVGRAPSNVDDNVTNDGDPRGFAGWNYETIESPLAEVIWFAIENPEEAADTDNFFGEPGMRTIYRRALLIAPWANPYKKADADGDGYVNIGGSQFKTVPGLLRLLPSTEFEKDELEEVFAALVAFQDKYDISARVEWDHNIQHWKIVANTLADLTKRENRYGHFGFFPGSGASNPARRVFPYAAVSWGSGYKGDSVRAVVDPEIGSPVTPAQIRANVDTDELVVSYRLDPIVPDQGYPVRPFVFVDEECTTAATARAMLNDDGEIVRVIHGPVPLWGARRGEDVMMSDVLAFDLRVYDPGAPLFKHLGTDTVLTPNDPGWRGAAPIGAGGAYFHNDNMKSDGSGAIGSFDTTFPYAGQGAYVDLGYGFDPRFAPRAGPRFPLPRYHSNFASSIPPWFFEARTLSDVFGRQLAPGYAVYDTWSFHYENNGVNEDDDEVEFNASGVPIWQYNDGDGVGTLSVDEGTNGLDDFGHYSDGTFARLGVDDVGERETSPPYDKPLRGVQVLIRTYERDARSIRQVRVNQHFMPE